MGYGDDDDDGYYMRNRNGYLHQSEEDDEFTKSVAKIKNILPSIFRIKQNHEKQNPISFPINNKSTSTFNGRTRSRSLPNQNKSTKLCELVTSYKFPVVNSERV
ncbi:hypothetical protein RUM43_008801 [Polyplax serrata]|uniref:Uncharacterized protein n=1 Tax=Polyplax serrata TaxID=468196 RepID=A0AAN8PVH2_POLSC